MTKTLCLLPVLPQLSLIIFIIEKSPEIFEKDFEVVWYETSLGHHPDAKASCTKNNPSNTKNIKKTEHGLSSCPSGRTCTPGHYALPIDTADPLCEGITGAYRCPTTITYKLGSFNK